MNDSAVLMQVEALERSFRMGPVLLRVLRGVDLDVRRGEILALTGASGVGKSTLLHLLGGLDRPTRGHIFFEGHSLEEMDGEMLAGYRNKSIGFVFQFHHLLPEFTALENIAMPLLIARTPKRKALDMAGKLLSAVGLEERASHKSGALSGGEQQRVALARALVRRPKLVLSDEPTGNLDEDTADVIFGLIRRLNVEFDTTFVIATHNMRLAAMTDRVLKLTDGRIEEVPVAQAGVI